MNNQTRFALILTGALSLSQSAYASPPNSKLWNGTWNLDAAKSKFASANKEQSETRSYQVSANHITMKSSSKSSAGKVMNFTYSATLDGKSGAMHGNPHADSISIKTVSDREINATSRLHGKTTVQSSAIVSADGKHLTLTRHMVAMKGAPTDVLEFDR